MDIWPQSSEHELVLKPRWREADTGWRQCLTTHKELGVPGPCGLFA